jgi:Peptidase family M1 domain/Peptidase M1 N-terminal domain
MKRALVYAVVALVAAVLSPGAFANNGGPFTPGAPGIGDPYFPLAGNGGYDVGHYLLDLNYDPSANHIDGVATISATATQNLSSFNLDLVGLNVHAITVNGWNAAWTRDAGELTVTPKVGLRKGGDFTVVVQYDGVPEPVVDAFGTSGVLPTDDGMVIVGEPFVAATWFPVNDHPLDKASYTFRVTVPAGLEVVSNGFLQSTKTKHGLTTFIWQEKDPMNSYLATATVGKFAITSYSKNGIRFYDAIDPALFEPVAAPTTGTQLAISGQADSSYKRLMRTITVPAGGATLSFWVTRDTEQTWDFMFVEAHTVGADDWTTLPDVNGHTSSDVGNSCPLESWEVIHPFLTHYQTDNGDGTCTPTGTTGVWWAATGASGPEQWNLDLAAYAGKQVEVSISYASDDVVQAHGVFIDDIATSTGEGNTSFEDDGDTLDGWTVPGAPAGSPGNTNDFTVGTVADLPPNFGIVARASFAREPEIVEFLSDNFGPYPFHDAGGVVDHLAGVGFALENQTRPIYAQEFFSDQPSGDDVIVHELAHQWYGDSVSVHFWADIWLNEGFATYAEWLWSEHEGGATPQEIFDGDIANIPADDPFWQLVIGDPGPADLFDQPIYVRGAMTLQSLRNAVGDDAFFRILRKWASSHRGGNGSTAEFIKLAERVSGQDLGALFDTWLFTAGKPDVPAPVAATALTSQAATSAFAGGRAAHAALHASVARSLRR